MQISNNIFNKSIVDPYKVSEKIIMLDNDISDNDVRGLDNYTSVVKVKYKYELQHVVNFYSNNYPNGSMNWLDVSEITDMSELFSYTKYNGDISYWDVSNVTNMRGMFYCASYFNSNISRWDVSNVKIMYSMFHQS